MTNKEDLLKSLKSKGILSDKDLLKINRAGANEHDKVSAICSHCHDAGEKEVILHLDDGDLILLCPKCNETFIWNF